MLYEVITIYQYIAEREARDSIMVSEMPKPGSVDMTLLDHFEEMKELIGAVRNLRQEKNLSPREPLHLKITANGTAYDTNLLPVVSKLANLASVDFVDKHGDGAITFLVRTTEYSVPMADLIDMDVEKARLEEELKYNQGFLQSVMKKLDNERFVNSAPAHRITSYNVCYTKLLRDGKVCSSVGWKAGWAGGESCVVRCRAAFNGYPLRVGHSGT